MKFLQLGLGERFEYEGAVYTKSSPMLATRDGDGGSRAIARSADVLPLGRDVPTTPARSGSELQRFHAQVRELVAALPIADPALHDQTLTQIDRLYREIADDV
ncbi:MAG: hypothetical protein KDI42_01170 [Gammaproteobacteria bacterium]|nr:hypothetical protein [Gammaproteobacteria bacterium]